MARPVFVYMFTWETPVLDGKLKSPHALEIPFVFDTVQTSGLTGDSPSRFALAEKMSRTWLAFGAWEIRITMASRSGLHIPPNTAPQ